MSVLVDCASNAEVNNDMNVDTHSTIEVGSDGGSDGGDAATDPDYVPSYAMDEDSAFDPVAPSVQEAYELRRALALSLRVVPVSAPVVVEGSRSVPIVIEEDEGPQPPLVGSRSAPIVIGEGSHASPIVIEEDDGPTYPTEEIDRFGNVVNPWVEDARVRDSEGHLVDAVDRAAEEGGAIPVVEVQAPVVGVDGVDGVDNVDVPVEAPIEAPIEGVQPIPVQAVEDVEAPIPVDGVHAVGVVRHPRNRLGRSGAALGLGGRSGRRRRRVA